MALLITLAQDPVLRWQLEPTQVELGQPITCVLEVPHEPGLEPQVPDLDLDYGWAAAGEPTARSIPGGTRLMWRLLALEPGQLELQAVEVVLGDGARLLAPPAAIVVGGALAPDEDAPRALPGFRTVEERTSPVRPRHLGWVALALLVLGSGGVLAWRRARRPRPEDQPTELERFQGLDRALERPLAIELATLLRGAAERHARLSEPRDGLTDEEWLATFDPSDDLDAEAHEELDELLSVCRDIKFAGARPTRFAIDDLLARAEVLLRVLQVPSPASSPEEESA